MRPILVLLACALVAACNSDDGGLSVAEYRDKANELCRNANRAAQRLDPPRGADELADFLERGLALGRKYDRQLDALEPPDELKRLHDQVVRLSDRLDRSFERLIARVRAAKDPIAEFQLGLQRLLGDIQQADELNQRLKLNDCLEAPGLRGTGPGPA